MECCSSWCSINRKGQYFDFNKKSSHRGRRGSDLCRRVDLLAGQGPEDWRDWTLHVSDELNDEILVVPFSSMLGKLH